MGSAEIEAVESATSVSYVCDDCGRVHNRNSPPCNDCGSMSLSAAEDVVDAAQEIDESESWRIVRDANRGITGLGVFVYIVGTLTLLAGVLTLLGRGWIVGVTLVAAGILAIPALRWRIESRLEVHLSSRTVLGLYVVLVVGGFALASFL